MALITFDLTTCLIINQVIKSAQINMIFSYKNCINKRYLKPLLFSEVLVKLWVILYKLRGFTKSFAKFYAEIVRTTKRFV